MPEDVLMSSHAALWWVIFPQHSPIQIWLPTAAIKLLCVPCSLSFGLVVHFPASPGVEEACRALTCPWWLACSYLVFWRWDKKVLRWTVHWYGVVSVGFYRHPGHIFSILAGQLWGNILQVERLCWDLETEQSSAMVLWVNLILVSHLQIDATC